jgi:hypothetical protein
MSFNNLSNYTGMAGGGLELSSQISGLGSETGQVADGDTVLEAVAKINDRLPLSGGTITGLVKSTWGVGKVSFESQFANYGLGFNGNGEIVSYINGVAKSVVGANLETLGGVYIGGRSGTSADVILFDGGSGILARRNGVTAQEDQIYGTYTDDSNYERLALRTAAGDYTIAAEAAGTGTQRNLVLSGANRAAHIADVSSGTDAAYETAINAIIAALESHGIAATS